MVTIGVLLLLVCLAGTVLGAYMALDKRSREPGIFFAAWWISGVAGAGGIVMRDGVTFLVGVLCFAVSGAAFVAGFGARRSPPAKGKVRPRGNVPEGSEKTTKENRSAYRRAAS